MAIIVYLVTKHAEDDSSDCEVFSQAMTSDIRAKDALTTATLTMFPIVIWPTVV